MCIRDSYLFLLADLFCCAAVLTIFHSFYDKSIKEKNAYISIIIGLFIWLLRSWKTEQIEEPEYKVARNNLETKEAGTRV